MSRPDQYVLLATPIPFFTAFVTTTALVSVESRANACDRRVQEQRQRHADLGGES